ncbi:hypothetical protein PFLUV_G00229660 [Xyrichtys novacula]|uniref:Immunoglobulin V-set domain-containing protein n=1 Tax=Xyrichtys novacula TaxID=13765 RepID=A0AAV1GNF6_XYRNO|nr:hypothetical protein PFLUV_G00229660 [Xyrichtys novacula]
MNFKLSHSTMIFIYCFTLKVLLFAGSSVSVKVTQTPADLFYTPVDTAIIYCSQDDIDYDRILWYKKTNGTLMQFLGYMYGTGVPEKGINVKINGSGSKDQNCTLIIENVNVSSSAVYFCAASTQCHKPLILSTETSSS